MVWHWADSLSILQWGGLLSGKETHTYIYYYFTIGDCNNATPLEQHLKCVTIETSRDFPPGGYLASSSPCKSTTSSPSKKKAPVPTPRSVFKQPSTPSRSSQNVNQLNSHGRQPSTAAAAELGVVGSPSVSDQLEELDRLIHRYTEPVVDQVGADDYCPVCVRHLDQDPPSFRYDQ